MLKGFREFIMRGNLVELAVAFILATSFALVVSELVAVIMGFVGKLGGQPDFGEAAIAGVVVGGFINAVISFVLIAAVVYFFVVTPYNKLQERRAKGEETTPPSEEVTLLTEIRDLLRTQQDGQRSDAG
jgi:large conductance mechanosensitive channel